eukprot:199279-Chlamydomonas_euryale.AAC.5
MDAPRRWKSGIMIWQRLWLASAGTDANRRITAAQSYRVRRRFRAHVHAVDGPVANAGPGTVPCSTLQVNTGNRMDARQLLIRRRRSLAHHRHVGLFATALEARGEQGVAYAAAGDHNPR